MSRSRARTGVLRRLGARARDDAGVSIIEVAAAAMIFMLVSAGVAQALVNSIRLSADQRSRVTALSLAATEIDSVRAVLDPFSVNSRTRHYTVDGLDYTVKRETSWVSATGLDVPCGGGGGENMLIKRVNVKVSWSTMTPSTAPVESDTLLAPNGRINDPSRGTIVIGVIGEDGLGVSGVHVSVTADPANPEGAITPVTQPPDTDSDGCSYALQLMPGNYRVVLSRTNYVSVDQVMTLTRSVSLTAGGTQPLNFQYDEASTLAITYDPAPCLGGPCGDRYLYPTDFETTWLSTSPRDYVSGTAPTRKVFPWSSGYSVLAGHYVPPGDDGSGGCRAVDPTAWAGVDGAIAPGEATPAVATEPGGTNPPGEPLVVRSGWVQLQFGGGEYNVTATSLPTGLLAGNPGCANATVTYHFTGVKNADRLVLPFGTWRISAGRVLGTNSPWASMYGVSGNVVDIDPRLAVG